MKDELALLKEQADTLGIQYSNNIGLETLRNKIRDMLEPKEVEEVVITVDADKRKAAILDQTKLIRIRLTCMNPAKAKVPGAFYSVSNKYIGTIRKYVPFQMTDEGYHVPKCIYDLLKRKNFQMVNEVNDRDAPGGKRVVTQEVSEFAISVLPQLTTEQLNKLAVEQKATNRV